MHCVVSETDIRRAAYLVIQKYGDDAEARAILWAAHFRNVDDITASDTWSQIGKTIPELRRLIALQNQKIGDITFY
jgi:hypothetical protein